MTVADQHTAVGGVGGEAGRGIGVATLSPVIAPTPPAHSSPSTSPTARVRVLVVTWNRRECAAALLGSLSRQTYPTGLMDVTVIDTAGTDATLEHQRERFSPELVVHNETDLAHEPAFREEAPGGGADPSPGNTLGFGSLTLIRNRANLGGCGGFNTGFAFTEWAAARVPSAGPRAASSGTQVPDYLWLVDDDADVPPDALAHLARVMEASADAGLVGSRTVNIADRRTTIESTIYYNFHTGAMQDDCPRENPKRKAWQAWLAKAGGTRGERPFGGQIDVDVVSACSMLARWGAVTGTADAGKPPVGFWDWRYFIYCDDADWCLRFAKAGWRVVLSLDAVVYHTPWNLKLTPARIYYANRNKVWMGQKVLAGRQLRTVTKRAVRSILRDSLFAAWHRRLFHAGIILDTARDIEKEGRDGSAGKTGSDGPPAEPVFAAMRRLGLLDPGAVVAVLCGQSDSVKWAEDLMGRVRAELRALPESERSSLAEPMYQLIARNDVPLAGGAAGTSIVYGSRRASKIKKQAYVLRARPKAVVVFDQTNDFPVLLAGGHNLHIDMKRPTLAQVERDGWAARLAFMLRWIPTALRCMAFAARVKPYQRTGRYG